MSKIRVIMDIDTHDMGVIMNLVGEGKVNIRSTRTLEQEGDADTAIRDMRAKLPAHRPGNGKRVSGLRTIEFIIGTMQSKPDDIWDTQALGLTIEADFGFSRDSISGAMTALTRHGYTEHVGVGKYTLTALGKTHPQQERLPFSYSSKDRS